MTPAIPDYGPPGLAEMARLEEAREAKRKAMTARQIIEARLGHELPATRDLPPDLRRAIKLLAIQRIRSQGE